jgi:hypothetical protein
VPSEVLGGFVWIPVKRHCWLITTFPPNTCAFSADIGVRGGMVQITPSSARAQLYHLPFQAQHDRVPSRSQRFGLFDNTRRAAGHVLPPTAVRQWKCMPLRPTLEIGFDIVAAIFQQAQRFRTQQHGAVVRAEEVFQFALFVCG